MSRLIFAAAVVGAFALLGGCGRKPATKDEQTFWRYFDSTYFRTSIDVADPYVNFDSLSKRMKSEPLRSIAALMREIQVAEFKLSTDSNRTGKAYGDSTDYYLFADSLKTIKIYQSDSIQIKLSTLTGKYGPHYAISLAWAYFYEEIGDFRKEDEFLVKAYTENAWAELLVMLGDNANSQISTEQSKAITDSTGAYKLKDSTTYKRLVREKLDYYDSASNLDSRLYSSLLKTAETLNEKGQTKKKNTAKIKDLISRAIALEPRWKQALKTLTVTAVGMSQMEYEEIYNKQIALGDSDKLFDLAQQKASYNLPKALSLYKTTYKPSSMAVSNAFAESFLLFALKKPDAADSTLRSMIQRVKGDTSGRYSADELPGIYLVRAYQHRMFGRYAKALVLVDSASSLDKTNDGSIANEKTLILLKSGRRNEAASFITSFVSLVNRRYSSKADSTDRADHLTLVRDVRLFYGLP